MMSMHAVNEKSCYCCTRPRQNMDVDSALNELGMLSSVTDIRKQYVAERNRRRTRQLSDPAAAALMVDTNTVCMTPSNSPDKSTGYQVIKLNPQFVTSLSSGLEQLEVSRPQVQSAVTFGARYSQDSLEREARNSRRASRLRYSRFRKPYELPWLQRHSIDVCYGSSAASGLFSNENSSDSFASAEDNHPSSSAPPSETTSNLCLAVASESPRTKLCSSSSGSPEKTLSQGAGAVARSKSLDDLDISKLRLAEAENHNFIRQKKEIDSVSQYMQNLNVNE